jgi:hypothetical protein
MDDEFCFPGRVRLIDLFRDHVEIGPRLRQRSSGLQAAQQIEPAQVGVGKIPLAGHELLLHRNGRPEIRSDHVGSRKSLRRDSDDGEFMTIHNNGFMEDGRVTPEMGAPEHVTHDDVGARARRFAVFTREVSSQNRSAAKDREVVARDELPLDLTHPRRAPEAGFERSIRGQTGEDLVVVAVLFVF